MKADRVTVIGSLRECDSFSNCNLHYPAFDTLVLCPRFLSPQCSIQDGAAVMCCSIDWCLRIASLTHNIPMLTYCVYLEQGNRRRALHQCARDVDCTGYIFLGLGHLCRRTPIAYDLASPNYKTREGCDQRCVPTGVIVRSILALLEGHWLTGSSIAVVNLIRLPKLINVSLDDLTCSYSIFPFDEMT